MEWDTLLRLDRLNNPDHKQQKHRPTYVQDMDRILFSQPFRRLANKTQVHPLYDNDHIHHRLIHSLEVAGVGRSLGTEVGAWLADERGEIPAEQVEVVAGLVQTACMAHDIGNPPFGHSGEEAISSWFHEKFSRPQGIFGAIPEALRHEFMSFEGNAQGFRILTRTEMHKDNGGFQLALGSLGAFAKYPVSAFAKAHVGDEGTIKGTRYIGLKKYGFFDNDVATFQHVATQLGLPQTEVTGPDGTVLGHWWRRHPLAFLMEAADDICYTIMDLEDAHLAGDITLDQVRDLLGSLFAPTTSVGDSDNISLSRALAFRDVIPVCVDAFKDNYEAIMQGNFAISLVDASRKAAAFAKIKEVMQNRIFTASRKTELEVYGRNVVFRALDGLLPLLEGLFAIGRGSEKLSPYHVQVARAVRFPLAPLSSPYDALHTLADFVSGMTDRYAVKVADMLGR
jgi:dGTPase